MNATNDNHDNNNDNDDSKYTQELTQVKFHCLEGIEGSQGMGVVGNRWFDCVLSLNDLHARTLMLTNAPIPFLGTPIVPLKTRTDKINCYWKVPVNVHWAFAVSIHGKSEYPLQHTTEK